MFLGTGWTGSATDSRSICRQDRGGDNEPNDDANNASSIAVGELLEGSLRTPSLDDYTDYYKVEGGVPYGKILCATLFLIDYDVASPTRINFNVEIYYSYGGYFYKADSTTSLCQTEIAVTYQYWNDTVEQMWLRVYANYSSFAFSDPGRYRLTVSLLDLPVLSGTPATGYIDSLAGPRWAYYNLSGPADDKGMRLRLQGPRGTTFALEALNKWSITGERWWQNYSYANSTTGYGELCLVGCGGQYNVFISASSGGGTYTLTSENYGGPLDNNNFPSKATLVSKNSINYASVAAGVDSVDWWKVNMKENIPLPDVNLTLVENEYAGPCNFSVFDKDLEYVTGADCFGYLGYRSADFPSLTTNYTGPLYFAVRTTLAYYYYGYSYFYTYSGGYYKLGFKFANSPPQLNSSLPDVTMDEGTTDSSLVLSDHVWDPDGDHLNYSLTGSKYSTRPSVERETGRVSFTPRPDWWGQETVWFQVQDDGPYPWNTLNLSATVIVNPVNEPPFLKRIVPNAIVDEDTVWESPDLATLFSDVDDDCSNLTFGYRVVSSDAHPPGAQLPVKFDTGKRIITIGPAHLFYGNFTIQLNCTDDDPAMVPACTAFNITIAHVNHAPALSTSASDPMQVTVRESDADYEVPLEGVFTDPDMLEGYASDRLSYMVTGMKKLGANMDSMNRLIIDARKEEYRPGFPESETLTVTATDMAGMAAMLNISVTIEPVNDPPVITAYQPVDDIVTLKEGQKKAFSVTVIDADTATRDLAYSWYLDGVKDLKSKDVSYSYETDFFTGEGMHRIRMDVSDGASLASKEWVVVVADVNRLPEGSIRSPLNFSSFVKGTEVKFAAEGSDPDGDSLTFTWRDSAGNELGRGANFTTKSLQKGSRTIRLEMNDTKGSTYRDVTIVIKDQGQEPKKTPGFEGAALLASAGASGLIAALRRGGPRLDDRGGRGRRNKRSRQGAGTAVLSILVLCLLLPVAGPVGSTAGQVQAAREGHGGDIEPNDNISWASPIAAGEVVTGSLLIDPANDYQDSYLLDGGLAAGKMMCVTLYLIDYDPNAPARFNFNMRVNGSTTFGYVYSENRTETVTYFHEPDGGPMTVYVNIMVNYSGNITNATTEPGKYQLSISIYDPPIFSGATATGFLDRSCGPWLAVYRWAGPAIDTGARVKIDWLPKSSFFNLSVFNIWPVTNRWWCLNCSNANTGEGFQVVDIVGVGGAYYILINAIWYNGTYTLTTVATGGPLDDDNSPPKATLIGDDLPYAGFVASGRDPVDWWKVNVKADVPLENVYARLTANQFCGTFNFIVFDYKVRILTSGTMITSHNYALFEGLTVSYDGPLYFAFIAGAFGAYANQAMGWYTLQFKLPNDPPQLNGSIPTVVMNEDTGNDSLVLSDYIIDPDGDHVGYTLLGSYYNTTPKLDKDTGRVNFTPKLHWWGDETVRFQAQDDGPGQKFIRFNVTVIVNSVNDFPAATSSVPDAGMKEEAEWQTPDLATIFSDVDDLPGNLSFGCRVVSSDTHPPGAPLPIGQDSDKRIITIGPAHLAFGTFTMELTCTDGHPGTVPASLRFNLTVGHVNHDPGLRENINNPLGVMVREHDANCTLALDGLFTDPDLPDGYAGDHLTYSVTGMKRLGASLDSSKKKLVLDASTVEYKPGSPEWETLTVTAKDTAGRSATLNISVTIEPINDPPVVSAFQPAEELTTVKEGQKKVFSITAADVDTDSREMTYAWYVDGNAKMHGKNNSYSFEPDYSMGGATHLIEVDVSDGNTTVSKEWQVLVADVNRPPEGSIKSPVAMAKFVKGAATRFVAEGSDPDGDNLTFIWRDGSGTELGRGANFTTKSLQKGNQTVRLEINDTKDSIYRDVTVVVTEQAQKKTPGFAVGPLLTALGLSLALSFIRRSKRPGK